MDKYKPHTEWVDDSRASCPFLLRVVSSVALSLFRTEPGALEILAYTQASSPLKAWPHPVDRSYRGPVSEQSSHQEQMSSAMTLSRRHHLAELYAVRQHLLNAWSLLWAEKAKLPPMGVNLHAVWYLFVEEADTDPRVLGIEPSAAYFETVGRRMLEARVLESENPQHMSVTLVRLLNQRLEELGESGIFGDA